MSDQHRHQLSVAALFGPKDRGPSFPRRYDRAFSYRPIRDEAFERVRTVVSVPRDLGEELASAERQIAGMEDRVACQTRNVKELVVRHQGASRAKELLERLQWSLAMMRERREVLLRDLHGDPCQCFRRSPPSRKSGRKLLTSVPKRNGVFNRSSIDK